MNTDVVDIAIGAGCRRHTIWVTVVSERAQRVATYGGAATVSVAVGNSQRHGVLSGRVVGCFQQRWRVSAAPYVATRCARSDVGLLRFDASGICTSLLIKQGKINQDGVQVQANHYYPYGATMGEGLANSTQPYKYGGKELDTMNGLNQYDFGARQQDSALGIFTTVDPMAEKYPSISPYAYCAGNPILYTDPTGMEIEADKRSQLNILNTLTKEEVKYVSFNNDGTIDKKKLNKSTSKSENMKALKALANSKTVYSFNVSDKDHAGTEYYEKDDGTYYRGTTEMPGATKNPSPDDNVYIIVGSNLDEKQQALTTAHEGYGHAYTYEITGSVSKASHTFENRVGRIIWDDEFQINSFEMIKVPTNKILENRIKRVVNQASYNYEKRNQK